MFWTFTVALAILVVLASYWAPGTVGTTPRLLLSGYTVIVGLFTVYGLLPQILLALRNFQYFWVPLSGGEAQAGPQSGLFLLALASFVGTYRLLAVAARHHAASSDERAPDDALPLAYAFLVIGLVLKLYLLVSVGGVSNATLGLAGSTRDLVASNDVGGTGLRSLSSVGDLGATWALMIAMKNRTHLVLPVVALSANMLLSYLTIGKRLSLVLPVLVILLAINRYRRPLKFALAPVILVGGIAAGMATLFFRIFVPARVAGVTINLDQVQYAQGSPVRFYFNSLEFSTSEMMAYTTRAAAGIRDEFGGRWNTFAETSLKPFLFGVPRQIWPSKPTTFTDISYAVNASVNGYSSQTSDTGYIVTYVGSSFIYLGVAGTLIFSALLAFAARVADKVICRANQSPSEVVLAAVLLNLLFQFFRQGTFGWVFINTIVQQVGFYLAWLALYVNVSAKGLPEPRYDLQANASATRSVASKKEQV